jgi:hypothetical protein
MIKTRISATALIQLLPSSDYSQAKAAMEGTLYGLIPKLPISERLAVAVSFPAIDIQDHPYP